MKFKNDATASERANTRDRFSAIKLRVFRTGVEHWSFDTSIDVRNAAQQTLADSSVEYAHPNYAIALTVGNIPDDPNFTNQWNMYNTGQTSGTADADIDAELAWDIETGSTDVWIAVTDSGVDYEHEDIAGNMWQNDAEVNGDPNADDDGCGYIDDEIGWDMASDDADPMPHKANPIFYPHHGTHVGGIIGAEGDNSIAVAGTMWNVSLMNLKILTPGKSHEGFVSDAIEAIDYATCMSADIINASWAIEGQCPPPCASALEEAIEEAGEREIAFVVASGNNNHDIDEDPNINYSFPCGYDLNNIICVGASDDDDEPYYNYGSISVDLIAPGVNVFSLEADNGKGTFSGTSMAAPHVSAAAGLLRSMVPQIPVELLKARILNNVDVLESVDPNSSHPVVSSGRLNLYQTINGQDQNAPSQITDLQVVDSDNDEIDLQWTATGDDGTTGTATLYQVRYSTSTITESGFYLADKADDVPAPASQGSTETYDLQGLSQGTVYYIGLKAFDEWGNGPLSNVVSCRTDGGVCTQSFCKAVGETFKRCTHSSSYGTCGCCEYSCTIDETCTEADPCPPQTCSSVCQ